MQIQQIREREREKNCTSKKKTLHKNKKKKRKISDKILLNMYLYSKIIANVVF